MCYVTQYSASFNTVINWLDIFWHLFQTYIIFKVSYYFLFAMHYIQKKICWSRKLNIYFDLTFILKINLVSPLRFKVINVKNLHSKKLKCKSKYCNANVFQLINFCNCRIHDQHFYLYNILSLQKQIEPHAFVLSVLQFILSDLATVLKIFNRKKKYILIIGI